MRILARDRVLFTGQHRCPEFDYPQEPLPEELKVLLCLLDGAERRRHLQDKLIQDKLNALHPRHGPGVGESNVLPAAKR
jgi:hypothetical protein